MKLIVCGNLKGNIIRIGEPFEEEDRPFIEKLIEFPVATQYGTLQPEEMWIQEITA